MPVKKKDAKTSPSSNEKKPRAKKVKPTPVPVKTPSQRDIDSASAKAASLRGRLLAEAREAECSGFWGKIKCFLKDFFGV